jgi:periplasmic divalent cation tolerance protein
MKLIAVITTVEKLEDAQRIARTAVASQLAACAQLEAIDSIYSWNGKIENSSEIRITLKTTVERCQELMAQMVSNHPYETPAIYTMEVAHAYQPYTKWVSLNTRKEVKP